MTDRISHSPWGLDPIEEDIPAPESIPEVGLECNKNAFFVFPAITGGLQNSEVRLDVWLSNRFRYKENPDAFPMYRIVTGGSEAGYPAHKSSLGFGSRKKAVEVFQKLTGVNIDKIPEPSTGYFCKCSKGKGKPIRVHNYRDAHRSDRTDYTCCYKCGGYIPGRYET
jgi:hypothetical protein